MHHEHDDTVCQSCGLPFAMIPEDRRWGTDEEGRKSAEYCGECYHRGEYREEVSMDQMRERIEARLRETNAPNFSYNAYRQSMPGLKRWKSQYNQALRTR